ncbi:MAG: hypothetical protein H6714_01170 [Myxococcales bacterium]|nr:hypothetical protein [Myxococcales bacterium]
MLAISMGPGSRFAWMMVVIAISAAGGGCLVLDRHDRPRETNYPPSIASAANAIHPQGEIVRVEPDSDNLEVVFEFVVRDPNIDQPLEYRVFLDRVVALGLTGLIEQDVIQPVNSVERAYQFNVGRDRLLGKPCTKVELLVAGEFEPNENVPVSEGDMDTATWWVTSVSTLDLADCVQ